jgi:hypothetical protein
MRTVRKGGENVGKAKRSKSARMRAIQDRKEQALMMNGLQAIYCDEFPVEKMWCQRAVRLMEGKYRGC